MDAKKCLKKVVKNLNQKIKFYESSGLGGQDLLVGIGIAIQEIESILKEATDAEND